MISLENYELEYSFFLAENEMNQRLLSLKCSYINESVGIISINESVKETIMGYISKISKAITKVWERFKEIVGRGIDQAFLKLPSTQKKINETEDPGFTIVDYIKYDLSKLNTIQIIPFNYEEMKPNLISKEKFIDTYYQINNIEGSNVKEKLNKMVCSEPKEVKCTRELLQSMYKTLTSGLTSEISKLEKDLKTLNNSNTKIEQLANSALSADTSTQTNTAQNNISTTQQESSGMFGIYILEKQVKFKDDPEKKQENNDSQLIKEVTNYIKGSSEILSVKLEILKNLYSQCMRTIKHFIKPPKEENEKQEKEPKNKIEI